MPADMPGPAGSYAYISSKHNEEGAKIDSSLSIIRVFVFLKTQCRQAYM